MQPATTLPFPGRRVRLTAARVLAALESSLEPKTAEQLAESLGVPASSVSPALARLERQGRAQSMRGAPDPKSHRRRLVWSAGTGKAASQPQEDRVAELEARMAAMTRRLEQLEAWRARVTATE